MNYMNWEGAPKNPFYPPSWTEQIRQNRQELMNDYLPSFPKRTPVPVDLDISKMIADLEELREKVDLPKDYSFNSGAFDIIIQSFMRDGEIVKLPETKTSDRHLSLFPKSNTTLYMNSDTAYKFFFMMFDFDVALECCERIALAEVDKVIQVYLPKDIEKSINGNNWKSAMLPPVLKHNPEEFRSMFLNYYSPYR